MINKYIAKKLTLILSLVLFCPEVFAKNGTFLKPLTVVSRLSQNVSTINPINKYLIIFGILLFTLIIFLIWYKYGKDEIVIPVVNFYPPKNINPIEAELVYKGKATHRSITAFVIYLASKGYIKIEKDKDAYIIHQSKNIIQGMTSTEKIFLKAMFPFDYEFVLKDELQTSYIFHDNSMKLIDDMNKKREIIFFKESINMTWLSVMILCILFIFVLIGLNIKFFGLDLITFIINIICISISIICTYQLPKRTNVGNRLLGQLLGLKKFIEVAKKHEIEKLVNENPNYFLDILPFAYIFNVTNEWIKNFDEVAIIDKNWAVSNEFFSLGNLQMLNSDLNELNNRL